MNKAKLIFLIGAAGSGKSTVGKLLAGECHYCYLDKDIVANRFTAAILEREGYDGSERDQCQFYKDVVYSLEYETLLNLASENLKLGNSVVLDAPFLGYFEQKDYVQKFMQEYDIKDVDAYVLRVFVSEETLKRRIKERNNQRDFWKLENWDEFYASINKKVCLWEGLAHKEFDNSFENLNKEKLLSLFN